MGVAQEISQRDLRTRSREIMDAVEGGESFTVTRDGRQIADLLPRSTRRQFVPAAEFLALGRGLAPLDPAKVRGDLDTMADPYAEDPYER